MEEELEKSNSLLSKDINSESIMDETTFNSRKRQLEESPGSPSKKKKKTSDSVLETLNEVTKYLKNLSTQKEDMEDIYGQYIAHNLRTINDPNKRELAKIEIHKILCKIKFDIE